MADGFDKLRRYAASLDGRLRRGLLRATLFLQGLMVRLAPVVTGNLRNSIGAYVRGMGLNIYGLISITAKYSGYVIRGTGIYGPHKRRIYPTEKKALRFVAGGKVYIRRSVKGQKKNPFPLRAWKQGRERARQIFGESLK